MKKTHLLLSLPLALGAMSVCGGAHADPIFISAVNTAFTQDFNTLAGPSSTPPVLAGSTSNIGTGNGIFFNDNNTTYTVGTGSGNAGDTYSLGTTAIPSDRALGSVASGSVAPVLGLSFVNNTGSVINSLSINYDGELYRRGVANRPTGTNDMLAFSYSVGGAYNSAANNASLFSSATYTSFTAGNYIAPTASGTATLSTPVVTNYRFSLTGLNLANGSQIFFRFTDSDSDGADDALGIDNFTVATPEPETWAMMALGLGALAMFTWKRKKSEGDVALGSGLAL